MNEWNPEWDRRLSRQPFENKRFTRAMMRNVENRLNDMPIRQGRRLQAYAAVLAGVLLVLVPGVIWLNSGNGTVGQNPPASHAAGGELPATQPAPATPSEIPGETIEPGPRGDAEWWADLDKSAFAENDQTLIAFAEALLQRKLGILGEAVPESDALWERPEDKQALARYDISSPWVSEVFISERSETPEGTDYKLRLLLTDSTQSVFEESIALSIRTSTHKISHVEVLEPAP